jgi:CubicO group peptidase (beta-lactamase class C family)
MMLWEEGLLPLAAPVAKYIPSFASPRVYKHGPALAPLTAPASERMLVRHLLTHTSGLTYGFLYRDPVDEALRLSRLELGSGEDFSLAELCDRLASFPLVFEPGTEWNYSYSTDVLGRIIEVVSGQSLDEFLQTRIIRPLGMTETGYTAPSSELERVAALYSLDPVAGRAVPTPQLDRPLDEARVFNGGGHGLVSTAADYNRFLQMLVRGGELDGVRLLAPKTVELMVGNHLPGGVDIATYARPSLMSLEFAGLGFGLGFSVLVDRAAADTNASLGTFGWGGAAGTEFWVDPAEELTVVFMTQVLWAFDDLRAELRRLVYQALVE